MPGPRCPDAHDVLMVRLAHRNEDKRLLGLIRRYLQAGLMAGGLVSPRREGTPQGGLLSPLLSNILLDDLDKELERCGHAFVRYADDCSIFVQSVQRLRLKLKALMRQGRGRRLDRVCGELRVILIAWLNYFGLAEVRSTFDQLDGWLRRRLRAVLWRQWKRPATRRRRLIELGLDEARAWKSAANGRGPWWNAGASHMNQAIPTRYLRSLGLVCLVEEHRRLSCAF